MITKINHGIRSKSQLSGVKDNKKAYSQNVNANFSTPSFEGFRTIGARPLIKGLLLLFGVGGFTFGVTEWDKAKKANDKFNNIKDAVEMYNPEGKLNASKERMLDLKAYIESIDSYSLALTDSVINANTSLAKKYADNLEAKDFIKNPTSVVEAYQKHLFKRVASISMNKFMSETKVVPATTDSLNKFTKEIVSILADDFNQSNPQIKENVSKKLASIIENKGYSRDTKNKKINDLLKSYGELFITAPVGTLDDEIDLKHAKMIKTAIKEFYKENDIYIDNKGAEKIYSQFNENKKHNGMSPIDGFFCLLFLSFIATHAKKKLAENREEIKSPID